MKGVLVQVSSGAFSLEWVHPICILWNPYLYFKDFSQKKIILGNAPDFVKYSKKDRSCAYCEDKAHKGSKLECDITDCKKCFHITCAVDKELLIDCDKMNCELRHQENPDFIPVFCLEHKELGLNVMASNDKQARVISLKKRKTKNPFK